MTLSFVIGVLVSQYQSELDSLKMSKPNIEVLFMDVRRHQHDLDCLIPNYNVVVRLVARSDDDIYPADYIDDDLQI